MSLQPPHLVSGLQPPRVPLDSFGWILTQSELGESLRYVRWARWVTLVRPGMEVTWVTWVRAVSVVGTGSSGGRALRSSVSFGSLSE